MDPNECYNEVPVYYNVLIIFLSLIIDSSQAPLLDGRPLPDANQVQQVSQSLCILIFTPAC